MREKCTTDAREPVAAGGDDPPTRLVPVAANGVGKCAQDPRKHGEFDLVPLWQIALEAPSLHPDCVAISTGTASAEPTDVIDRRSRRGSVSELRRAGSSSATRRPATARPQAIGDVARPTSDGRCRHGVAPGRDDGLPDPGRPTGTIRPRRSPPCSSNAPNDVAVVESSGPTCWLVRVRRTLLDACRVVPTARRWRSRCAFPDGLRRSGRPASAQSVRRLLRRPAPWLDLQAGRQSGTDPSTS